MAYRPTHCLIEGELDNTQPGIITGWMRFAGMKDRVVLHLRGDFHRDIQGTKIRFTGEAKRNSLDAVAYMQGFSLEQNGKAGDITAGLPPVDYVDYPYIEWYSEENGRVVIEPEREQVEVIGQPVPLDKTVRVSRQEQAANLNEYMQTMLQSIARQRQCSSFGRANVPPPMGITIVADCKAKKE